MTAPTIPPQQPEPERVCGNCVHFNVLKSGKKLCEMHMDTVWERDSCPVFRARKES